MTLSSWWRWRPMLMMMMIIMMMIPLRNERGMDEEYYYYYYYWWYSDSWWSCFAVTTVGMSPTTIAIAIVQRPGRYNTRFYMCSTASMASHFFLSLCFMEILPCVNQKIVGWSFTRLIIVSVLAWTGPSPIPRFPDSTL